MTSLEDIQVELNYNRDDGTRPYKFGRPRSKHERLFYPADEGGPREYVPVTVHDGREEDLKLDEASFELIDHETSMSTEDFYDEQTVKKIYYNEVATFLKESTGAAAVQIYHHQVINFDWLPAYVQIDIDSLNSLFIIGKNYLY